MARLSKEEGDAFLANLIARYPDQVEVIATDDLSELWPEEPEVETVGGGLVTDLDAAYQAAAIESGLYAPTMEGFAIDYVVRVVGAFLANAEQICVAEMNDDGWVCGAPIDGDPHDPQDPTKHDPVWRLLVPVGGDDD